MITLLGLDPGTNNMAYSVVQMRRQPERFKVSTSYSVIEHGMIKNPVKDMNGEAAALQMAKFAAEIRRIKRQHGCEFCTAERYMTRGHGGTTIEAISAMLGIVGLVFGRHSARFIPAAVWKNAFNKYYDLKAFYDELDVYGIPTHRVDAVSIGIYGATLMLGERHFTILEDVALFKKRLIKTK